MRFFEILKSPKLYFFVSFSVSFHPFFGLFPFPSAHCLLFLWPRTITTTAIAWLSVFFPNMHTKRSHIAAVDMGSSSAVNRYPPPKSNGPNAAATFFFLLSITRQAHPHSTPGSDHQPNAALSVILLLPDPACRRHSQFPLHSVQVNFHPTRHSLHRTPLPFPFPLPRPATRCLLQWFEPPSPSASFDCPFSPESAGLDR